MMAELCFHILDIVQNSYRAGASVIDVLVRESDSKDIVEIKVTDDGTGMDEETVISVQEPFYTTKSHKKVGLGIPLMKETALHCEGDFYIKSKKGEGTHIYASFKKSNIDRPPLGDIKGTVLGLITGMENVDIKFNCSSDKGEFRISITEVKEQAGDIPLSSPEVYRFLRDYIFENLGFMDE